MTEAKAELCNAQHNALEAVENRRIYTRYTHSVKKLASLTDRYSGAGYKYSGIIFK